MLQPSVDGALSPRRLPAPRCSAADVKYNEKGCRASGLACGRHVRGDGGVVVGGRWLVRAVMNKDVLCVELVVNHWQRWQLTDRQIDPRPPRERRLAPAHSSQPHGCAHTWRARKDCQKARRRSRRIRSSPAVCGS